MTPTLKFFSRLVKKLSNYGQNSILPIFIIGSDKNFYLMNYV